MQLYRHKVFMLLLPHTPDDNTNNSIEKDEEGVREEKMYE